MSNKKSSFQDKLADMANKMANIGWLQILQTAFISTLPLIMVGSFASLFAGLPYAGYQAFITKTGLASVFKSVALFTNDSLAVWVAFFIAHTYASRTGNRKNAIIVGITSIIALMVVSPLLEDGNISTAYIGSQGLFTAVLLGYMTGYVFNYAKEHKWEIKLPEEVPPLVSRQFSAVIPVLVVMLICGVIKIIFGFTSFGSLPNAIYSVIRIPLGALGNNFMGLLILQLIMKIMWFFGINGPIVAWGVLAMLFTPLQLENLAAYSAGLPRPNIVSGQTLQCGHGSLPFVIAALIFSKNKASKSIGRVAIFPASFGIDEPAYFGFPMIMNPVFFLPWCIINPILEVVGTYLLNLVGLLPYSTGADAGSFNLPFISNFAQYGWKGVLWGFVLLGVETVIAWIFLKIHDDQQLSQKSSEE